MRATIPLELAEAPARKGLTGRRPCPASTVDQLLAQLGELASAERQQARLRWVRETTAARQLEERRLVTVRYWLKARARLVAEIVSLDTALAPHGLSLSMGDDTAHPVDIAAVEIRLSLYGRPVEAILDIAVTEEGEHAVHVVGGARPGPRLALPTIRKVKPDQYRAVLTAYLAHGYPTGMTPGEGTCRCCGSVNGRPNAEE